jgi:hypothetical protein
MLMPRVRGYLALSAVVALCGCGTMANIEGRRQPSPSPAGQEVSRPFGGVRRDIEWLQAGKAPGNLVYAADLPLSFVGDLVTLPKTVIGTQSDSLLQEPGTNQGAPSVGMQAKPDPAP